VSCGPSKLIEDSNSKDYGSNPFYEFVKETIGANVIVPLKSNSKFLLNPII